MRQFITKTLLKGITVILPVVATVYVLIWLFRSSESLVRRVLELVLPEGAYLPGMGVVLLFVALFFVGLLMYSWIVRKLWNGIDGMFRKLPVISTIYSPFRDLMSMVEGDFAQNLGQPVMIKVPNTEMETLGFITRSDLEDLPEGISKSGHVVVYVQWSSQVGGYCFVVPEDSVRKVDMSVEDAFRWSLTAGLSTPKRRRGAFTSDAESRE